MSDNPTGQEMKALRLHLRDCPRCQGQRGDCSDPTAHARAVRLFAPFVLGDMSDLAHATVSPR